jgi:uncharacterized protein (TIGR02444 family)
LPPGGSAGVLSFKNPFWQFSVSVYAVPAVAAECLDLQQRFEIDVNLLLFCAWVGNARKASMSAEGLAAMEAGVAVWHEKVVRPLRAARQNLKPLPAMSDPAVARLRTDIAKNELRAEEIEQAMLFALADIFAETDVTTSIAEAIRHNVSAFLKRVAPPGADPSVPERLIAQAISYKA